MGELKYVSSAGDTAREQFYEGTCYVANIYVYNSAEDILIDILMHNLHKNKF